jgi:glucose/mannose transport system substrate-binding protein
MSMRTSKCILMAACAAFALSAVPAGAQQNTVEVLHWWTAGGTAAAVGKYKEAAKSVGVEWKDVAIAGDANQRTLLRARVMKGDAPAAAQISLDLMEYGDDASRLYSIDAIAKTGNWDAVLPPAVRNFVKLNGPSYVAVPLNIHRQSVMFVSDAALKKIGASAPPKTWDEFFVQADKAKAAGINPFAWGNGQVLLIVFQQVAFSVMGPDLFTRAFIRNEEAALKSPEMGRSIDTFRRIAAYADKSAVTKRWNEGTQSLIKGETLFQIMGDWAKAEFSAARQEAGRDFHCVPVPGTENSFYFNTDAILFFKSRNDNPDAKAKLAAVLMDPRAQEEFNMIKGSVPARTDADISRFDSCSQKSYADFKAAGKAGTLVPFPAMVLSAARFGAMTDVVVQFYAKPDTATADVIARLVEASRT